ncbi:MAG TPA: sn-glycerol-3-phosphate ABC transporter ATP-binding protein UgpC [Solirubrobacteraceae bacterium]|jgi:multiple sugar transport system ATP-binding protein|nr:sn-glycerol-3-phosphate ABC transporter ATP-binding protein UgpC [Solirubrobacteraceae bacterium]
MTTVDLDKLTKVYPNGTTAVSELDLEVAEGEFMVLVGPSGCGKTTALRMIAGLEEITAGELRMGGRVVNDLSPKERDIAMIFQNYALYPHMSVASNIGFALKLRKIPKDKRAEDVGAAARILGLIEQLERKPGQLSGGQRQRVAMGRAIVREPAVFLMDEPLSNLDAKLRVQMRAEIAHVQRRLGVATFYVTHDQVEAMTMGDRVAVLRSGRLQQCDRPQTLYDSPVNVFVASFIGSPAMNLYEATLAPDGRTVKLGSQTIALPAAVDERLPGLRRYRDRTLLLGIRPEHLTDAALDPEDREGAYLSGDIRLVEALGSELMVHFRLDAVRVHTDDTAAAGEDDDLAAEASAEVSSYADGVARVDSRSDMTHSGHGRFGVMADRLHFFDASSHEAIRD